MARRTKASNDTTTRPAPAPVAVTRTRDRSTRTALAWSLALHLAEGDRARLDYRAPGVVIVKNAA